MSMTLRRGIYETEYGNAAYVDGPDTATAFDLDMGQKIPIEMVTGKFIRQAYDCDLPDYEDDDIEDWWGE